jgi:uridine kinase
MLSPKRKLSFDQLIKWIHKSSQANELCIIGIDGGGGSGKSTFAQRISEEIPSSQIVAMDHFYLTDEDSLFDHDAIGGNFDWQLLRDEVLLPLREGAQGSYKTRDWEDTGDSGARGGQTQGFGHRGGNLFHPQGIGRIL